MLRNFFWLVVLVIALPCRAQQGYTKLVYAAAPPNALPQEYRQQAPKKFNEPPLAVADKVIKTLHLDGYIRAYVIDTIRNADTITVRMHAGERVRWGTLAVDDADKYLLQRASNLNGLRRRIFSMEKYSAQLQRLLAYLEDNGYPFAEITTDSVMLANDTLAVRLHLDKKTFVTIDSVYIPPDVRIARRYLYNYLQIAPKDPYNESLVRKIPTRIKELQFLELTKPPVVTFFANKAVLSLFLKNKNQNKFDFLLGIAPVSNAAAGQSRLLVTGDGQLNLLNALGKGEKMDLRFEKLQARTTRFHAAGTYPFLFSLPFGLDGGFNLFLNDTLYRNVDYNIGLLYLFSGSNTIKVYFQKFQSRLITVDTNLVKYSHQLPTTLDVNADQYGLAYNVDKTNFRLNPSAGFSFDVDGAVSLRSVQRNARITGLHDPLNPEFNYSTLYDTVSARQQRFIVHGGAAYYVRLFTGGVLALQERSGYISGNNPLVNELFRLGGFRTLRGFDEESIPSRTYHIGTVELRYLLGTYSYADVFAEGGYVKRSNGAGFVEDHPVGIGAGMNFQTKAGIFSINYAIGKTNSSGFNFRAAKIHFGYVTVF